MVQSNMIVLPAIYEWTDRKIQSVFKITLEFRHNEPAKQANCFAVRLCIYGFGRWSLPGTLGSWTGSLPIDFISFNLQTISREPHKGEVDGASFLSFPVTLGRAFMAKPSTKAFLNPSSLEFIFPTKGYVPVISPVPRLSPLSLRASSLRSSVRP